MCGFAGVVYSDSNRGVNPHLVKSMIDKIIHRGPDDAGIEVNGNVGLGFRRLSIIDLESGHQPLYDINKRACVTFNGEIYNYKELRKDLFKKGYEFLTDSDTEVLLNMYLEYGRGFVKYLRGMFAFVIHDFSNQTILLGRDHFGIKPLYFYKGRNEFYFASEIKSILEVVDRVTLNCDSLDSFLSYSYTLGNQSFYREIERVESGKTLQLNWKNNSFQMNSESFFKPAFEETSKLSISDIIEQTNEQIEKTVKRHLVSDVPVGAFLSGGIDSNAVVSKMIKLYPDKVKTFTIGFRDSEYNEAIIAREAANKYGTEHHELIVEPSDVNLIDKIVETYDEPFGDSSAIPTFLVNKLASEHVKVVLSGDGGDELFGGYNTYQRLLKIYKYKNLIAAGSPLFSVMGKVWPNTLKGKRFLQSLSKSPELQYAHQLIFNKREKDFLLSKEVRNQIGTYGYELKEEILKNSNSKTFASKLFELDLSTFMKDDVLVKVDRASMANSIEVRVPFIDVDFFNFASSIPSDKKIVNGVGKYLMREAIKNDVPESVYNKPKTGFTIPLTKWFKNDFDDYAKSNLAYLKNTGLVNNAYIDDLITKKSIGSLSTRIWPLMVFAVWHQKQTKLSN